MTNTETLADTVTEKPTANDLKIRIKYMLTHLTATIIMVLGLLLGIHSNNPFLIIFNATMGMFNLYFFVRHYDKLISAIEQLIPTTVNLEKS
jgi:predicted neutral ceramidase superfamily lipid hydrolase